MLRDKDSPYHSVSVAEMSDYFRELGYPAIYVSYSDGREEIHMAAGGVLFQLGNMVLKFKDGHGIGIESTMRTEIPCTPPPAPRPRKETSVPPPSPKGDARKTVADTTPLKPALPFTKGT